MTPAPEALGAAVRALVATPGGPPGALALVVRGGRAQACCVHGSAQVLDTAGEPLARPRPLTAESVFDVGSVTKLLTTAAIMVLVERGALALERPVGTWLAAFAGGGRERVTLADLLCHRAGLWEWWPLYVRARDPEAAVARIAELPLRYPPRTQRRYSDLGIVLAGEVARRATGRVPAALVRELVLEPLGLSATRYGPLPRGARDVVATSRGDAIERAMITSGDPYPVAEDAAAFAGWRERTLVGEVNDGNAHHAFGGAAAHAGAFTTAADLAAFGTALLGGAAAPWRASTVDRFTAEPHDPGQGLGFWTRRLAPLGLDEPAFGHAGFPGAQLAVIPGRELVVVLLTNRLHVTGTPLRIDGAWADVLRAALSA